nr:protein max-like [Dermacentor andersoni]
MNDEERDVDVEAERRAHHSALERRRRDHIKFTFGCLRDAVPSLQWERATRAQILKRAADYIQLMQRKNRERLHTIKELKRERKHLEEQIRALEEMEMANGGGDCSPSTSVVATIEEGNSASPAGVTSEASMLPEGI